MYKRIFLIKNCFKNKKKRKSTFIKISKLKIDRQKEKHFKESGAAIIRNQLLRE